MNMFDHLYYLIFGFYKKWDDFDPEFASVGVIALVQAFNILSVIGFLELFIFRTSFTNKYHWGGIVILMIAINYFRYFKQKTISEIEEYIAKHPEIEKKKALPLIYFWGSIIVMTVLAITGAIING